MISWEEYMALPKKYLADPTSDFMKLGEWFVLNYLPKNKHDSELFYEKEFLLAGSLIGKKYVLPKKEENVDLSKCESKATSGSQG